MLLAGLARIGRVRWLTVRYAIANLCRPGNQTKAVIFAVGIGTLFLVSVLQIQTTFRTAFHLDLDGLTADMFAIDIQPDQRPAAEAVLTQSGANDVRLVPIVRTRLAGLKWGTADHPNGTEDLGRRRAVGERRVTYGLTMDPPETVVSGRFWDATPAAIPEVSIEEDSARFLTLEVGDSLTFGIAGRKIDARVTSIRRMERRARALSYLTRSEILFRSGVLESAPRMFLAAARGPSDPTAAGPAAERLLEPPAQRHARRRPGRHHRDPRAARPYIDRRVDPGRLVYSCGVLILIGSIGVTRARRLYEAAILKTLGARRGVLAKIAATEFAVLGLIAGGIGSTASIALTWSMMAFGQSRTPWRFMPAINPLGIVSTVALVTIVGVLSTWNVLMRKPLGTLREH